VEALDSTAKAGGVVRRKTRLNVVNKSKCLIITVFTFGKNLEIIIKSPYKK
jgi:hypothetical protein